MPSAGTLQGVCENKDLLCLCSFIWSYLLDVTGSGHNKTWDNFLALARGGRKGPRKPLLRISYFLNEILPTTTQEPNAVLCDVWPTHKPIQISLNSSHQAHTPQVQRITLPNTDYAHKNITSNFSQARSTLPEYGSQWIRNM